MYNIKKPVPNLSINIYFSNKLVPNIYIYIPSFMNIYGIFFAIYSSYIG